MQNTQSPEPKPSARLPAEWFSTPGTPHSNSAASQNLVTTSKQVVCKSWVTLSLWCCTFLQYTYISVLKRKHRCCPKRLFSYFVEVTESIPVSPSRTDSNSCLLPALQSTRVRSYLNASMQLHGAWGINERS